MFNGRHKKMMKWSKLILKIRHFNQWSAYFIFLFVQGHSPQESCELAVIEAQRKAGTTSKPFEMALIAISKTVVFLYFAPLSFFVTRFKAFAL